MAEVAGGRALVIQCHGPSGLYDEERSDLFKLSLLVANFRYDLKMLYARWLRVAVLFVLVVAIDNLWGSEDEQPRRALILDIRSCSD